MFKKYEEWTEVQDKMDLAGMNPCDVCPCKYECILLAYILPGEKGSEKFDCEKTFKLMKKARKAFDNGTDPCSI